VETTAGTSHGEISGSFWETATFTLKARINSAVLVTRQRQPKEKIMNTVNGIDIEAPVEVEAAVAAGPRTIFGQLRYQGCLPPPA
jgi:hypothetical protein